MKFFTCKLEKSEDLIVHINKVKELTKNIPVKAKLFKDVYITMTLLISFLKSYNYFIVVLKS